MKKLPLFAGSAAVFAVAVFYFRPDSISTPPAESYSTQAPIAASAAVLKQNLLKSNSPKSNTLKPEQTKPQTLSLNQKSAPSAEQPPPVNTSDDFPLPEPVVEETITHTGDIDLWQLPEEASQTLVDGLPAVKFSLNPKLLTGLQVGQIVRLQLPDSAGDIEAEIRETYNDPAGVQVWKGSVKNDVHAASIILSRGEIQTHIVIASTQGNYSAVVDNRSGDGTLINESTIHSRQLPYDDGIVYRPGDTETPHQH